MNKTQGFWHWPFTGLLALCLLSFFSPAAKGQAAQKDSTAVADSVRDAHQRDLIDVYNSLFKKSAPRDFKGRFHNAPFPAAGYTLTTGLAAVISDNLAFYTADPSVAKMSSIGASFTYSQYNQSIFQSLASIWSGNNKFNLITDWRYMKYPSETFGLGGHTQYSDGYTIDFSYVKLHTSLLTQVVKNLYAGLGYYYDQFWDIKEVDPPPGVVTSFEKYGLSYSERSSGVVLRVLFDSRKNQVNPDGGFYANITYRANYKFLGSQAEWHAMQIDLRKYIKLSKDGRNILALWHFDWLSAGGDKTPYLLLPSTGWDDAFNTGRGYIQGRFRGQDMFYNEAEYRFAISRNGLFGGVLFANTQSFARDFSTRYNTIEPGYGFGLRIKLNKSSGANICLDYGFGLQGSQGLAVNLGEVF